MLTLTFGRIANRTVNVMKKIILFPLAAICLYWSGVASSADFVAVRVEAENFTSKSDRWVLTSPDSIPDIQPDPDQPHNSSASGNANMEVLPDTRVTHDDTLLSGGADGNYWGGSGGPRLNYNIEIPEAGRYLVYIKTYSTGTEDNGIHVGINGTFPDTGKRIQTCAKHKWFWTSAQRTDDNHCGVAKSISVDVLAAGTNTITFYAREDGFEIDQFLLFKETHDGSLDCFPLINDKVRCKNVASGATVYDVEVPVTTAVGGNTITNPPAPPTEPTEPTEPTPPVSTAVDLDMDISALGSGYLVGDTVEYRVKVTNKNDNNTATNTIATINLPAGVEYAGSTSCTENSNTVTCDFDNVNPGTSDTVSFFVTTLADGNHRVDAQVVSDEEDEVSHNNTDSTQITVELNIPDYEAGITLAQSKNVSATGGANSYKAVVVNNGLQDITDATVTITPGNGIILDTAQGCAATCSVPTVAPGESVEVSFHTLAISSGLHNVTVQLSHSNDADLTNNTATLTETVVASLMTTADNGNIVIEAENFNALSSAATENAPTWYLVNSNFSAFDPTLDPDQASPVSVSGAAYMELLPDNRIDPNGARTEGISNFSSGGVGATLSYNVFFAEAGVYNIAARIRANNTEDATLHIGLNNEWPATSASVSVCNPDGTWQWTSNLKTNNGCSITSAATLTVSEPGLHVVMVSQDTDGLELDKLILSQSQISVSSDNGPAAKTVDITGSADIALSANVSALDVAPNEYVDLVVSVANTSTDRDSVGLSIIIEGVTEPLVPTVFDSCTNSGSTATCILMQLDAGQQVTETFTMKPSEENTLNITTSVSSALTDNNPLNNSDGVTINVSSATAGGNGGGSLSLWFMITILLLLSVKTLHQPIPVRIDQKR